MVAGITNPTLSVDRNAGTFTVSWDYDLRAPGAQIFYSHYYQDLDNNSDIDPNSTHSVRASGSDELTYNLDFFSGVHKTELHFEYSDDNDRSNFSSRTYQVFDSSQDFYGRSINGSSDKDIIITGNYNDTIRAKNSNDMVDAGFGRDTIEGGLAKDQLFGGEGADTFVYKTIKDSTVASSGRDTIMDFSHRQGDVVDLHSIDANTKLGGNQSFVLIGSHDFTHHAGELRAVKSGGDTHISGDVNGDGKADFAIVLDPALTLQRGDFVL